MRKIEMWVLCKISMVGDIKKSILRLFLDSSNRPKKTPRHESAIQIMLEKEFTPSQVKNTLNIFEESDVLYTKRYDIKNVGEAKFYYSAELSQNYVDKIMPAKIEKSVYWIKRYSDLKTIKILGEHLHYLVKAELRAQGFKILQEKNAKRFRGKEWFRSRHTLDIIAEHKIKKIAIGVEVKNMLTSAPKSEIAIKLEMCRDLGIYPIFACRWQEGQRNDIENEGGLLWQFKNQLYPLGQENLVNELRKRFNFPVEVKGELPNEAITEFENYLLKFN